MTATTAEKVTLAAVSRKYDNYQKKSLISWNIFTWGESLLFTWRRRFQGESAGVREWGWRERREKEREKIFFPHESIWHVLCCWLLSSFILLLFLASFHRPKINWMWEGMTCHRIFDCRVNSTKWKKMIRKDRV